MTSYTTLQQYASSNAWMPATVAEFAYGKSAAKANRTVKAGSTWSIFETGEYRQASPDECAGIETGLVELAEALAYFGNLDEYEDALADEADSQDWRDTKSSLYFGFQMF